MCIRDRLTTNRLGLDLVARSLLEHETITGEEVSRLLQHSATGPTDSVPTNAAELTQAPSVMRDVPPTEF